MRLHNRQVKAEFWTDTGLKEHFDIPGRYFYLGLIQLADDSGCLEDSIRAFKDFLFPSDPAMSVKRLSVYRQKLIDLGKIIPYEVDGRHCLYLINFHKHQALRSPSPPSVPLPNWVKYIANDEKYKSGKYEVEKPYGIRKETVRKPYVVPISGSYSGSQRDGGVGEEGYTPEFEEFWKSYPRRVEKRSAVKRWTARLKEVPASERPARMAVMLAAAVNYAEHCQRNRTEQQFIKHPSTFLGPTGPFEEWAEGRRHGRPVEASDPDRI